MKVMDGCGVMHCMPVAVHVFALASYIHLFWFSGHIFEIRIYVVGNASNVLIRQRRCHLNMYTTGDTASAS